MTTRRAAKLLLLVLLLVEAGLSPPRKAEAGAGPRKAREERRRRGNELRVLLVVRLLVLLREWAGAASSRFVGDVVMLLAVLWVGLGKGRVVSGVPGQRRPKQASKIVIAARRHTKTRRVRVSEPDFGKTRYAKGLTPVHPTHNNTGRGAARNSHGRALASFVPACPPLHPPKSSSPLQRSEPTSRPSSTMARLIHALSALLVLLPATLLTHGFLLPAFSLSSSKSCLASRQRQQQQQQQPRRGTATRLFAGGAAASQDWALIFDCDGVILEVRKQGI